MNTTNQASEDKLVFRVIMAISVVIFIAVVVLNRKVLPAPSILPDWTYFLPKLNAFINGICTLLLLISLYFIKQKNIAAHKAVNLTAFVLSSIFLISYVVFHWIAPQTYYPDNAPNANLYYVILISHIILAAIVLPLVLLSFYRGLQMQVELHKKIVRFAYPIWLYVTITGVIVYLMISPYYPA
jgi:putative membrane protein